MGLTNKEDDMLNKKELIAAVAAESGVDEAEAREVLDALVKVTEREVRAGDGISLPGFGKMFAKRYPLRRVRNPKTGEWGERGPDFVLKFQPSAKLKRGLNG